MSSISLSLFSDRKITYIHSTIWSYTSSLVWISILTQIEYIWDISENRSIIFRHLSIIIAFSLWFTVINTELRCWTMINFIVILVFSKNILIEAWMLFIGWSFLSISAFNFQIFSAATSNSERSYIALAILWLLMISLCS